MRPSPSRWKALTAVATLALGFATSPESSAARERGPQSPAGGRVSIEYRHAYRPYYLHHAWPYYGYGLYGYGGYHGYGDWSPGPRSYPVRVLGESVADQPGAVETDVRPGRAQVSVDGKPAGQARDFNGTWDVLWLAPGSHDLEFSRDGYLTLRIRVDVDGGSYYRIRQRLNEGAGLDPRSHALAGVPESGADAEYRPGGLPSAPPDAGDVAPGLASGFLRIDVTPADAAVYLDGRYLANGGELARLHGALPVAQGEHTIEAVRPGYRSVKQRVTVQGDEPVPVTIRLERAGGGST